MQKPTKRRQRARPQFSQREGKKISRLPAVNNRPFALTGGFPDRARVRLRYNEQIAISGISQTQVWTGNGPFDPNVTGTGAQPYNYDDWSVEYNRVRCVGSTIKVRLVTTGVLLGTSQTYLLVAPRHTSTSAVSSSSVLQDAMSAPYVKWFLLNQLNSGDTEMLTHSHTMSTQEMLGLTSSELMSDQYQALVGANPAHLWYWHTSLRAVDNASTITAYMQVQIEYDLEFMDRLELTLDEKLERITTMRQFARRHLKHEAKQEETDERKKSFVAANARLSSLAPSDTLMTSTKTERLSNMGESERKFVKLGVDTEGSGKRILWSEIVDSPPSPLETPQSAARAKGAVPRKVA